VEDPEGLRRLGQGEARRHHLRLAGRDDHGAPVGRAPRAARRLRGTHAPYRGAAHIIPTLLSGDLNFALDNLASYLPVIQEGRLRGLAVDQRRALADLAAVPTMAEAGVPDFVVTSWCTLAFPAPCRARSWTASTPPSARSRRPAVQQRFQQVGAKVLWSTPEDAPPHAAKQRPMWRDLVQLTGARIE
jgi:tripartite-type tricarboxylate transporter receptor subunit TctC